MDMVDGKPRADKVAVVVIHGMGEQRPMETLRAFVETLWERNPDLFAGLDKPTDHNNFDTWSKPDRVSGSAELRRITTARARTPGVERQKGIRADFFELHWADITADSTWQDFRIWVSRLLFRNPFRCEVPSRVLLVWMFLWLISIAVVISVLSTVLSRVPVVKEMSLLAFLGWSGWGWVTVGLLVLGASVKAFLTEYFGDVARYATASPRNIKIRQAARDRGLKLLRQLHTTEEYLRVIVVGHSLGSILAHDLLALAWSDTVGELRLSEKSPILAGIAACEKAGLELLSASGESAIPATTVARHERGCACRGPTRKVSTDFTQKLSEYRQAQRQLFNLLRAETIGEPGEERRAWLISDLVTLGSPLAHANFLVARNGCELQVMTRSREILRSPPVYEAKPGNLDPVFTFRPSKEPDITRMHHAAAFAPVRWANLHDETGPWLFLKGDMISGPVSQDYGPGAVDLRVMPRRFGLLGAIFPRLFTHTLYWSYSRASNETPEHVLALRDAVNILDDPLAEARLIKRSMEREVPS